MRNEEGFVGEGSKETLVSKDDDEVEADEGDDSHLDWRNSVEVSSLFFERGESLRLTIMCLSPIPLSLPRGIATDLPKT